MRPGFTRGFLIAVLLCLASCNLGSDIEPPEPGPDLTADSVSGVTVLAGDGRATISWTIPTTLEAGHTFTVYAVEDTTKSCAVSDANQCVIQGLTNGAAYTFVVRVSGADGKGPFSQPTMPVTPAVPPEDPLVLGAPTSVMAVAGSAQATVSWAAPASNGGSAITDYLVWAAQDTTKSCQTTVALSCTVRGLTNGVSYTFTVRAVNAAGIGPASPSTNAVIPIAVFKDTIPNAPTSATAIAGNGQATVSWIAPINNGGSAITGYRAFVVLDTVKFCQTTDALSCTVTGLTNGASYRFLVRAINSANAGHASNLTAAVVPMAAGTKGAVYISP